MTPDDLTQIERAFEKAKAGSGPQALADWALQHGPALFAQAAEGFPLLPEIDHLAPLRPLYPGVAGDIAQQVADDVAALRAFRNETAKTGRVALDNFTPEEQRRMIDRLAEKDRDELVALAENNSALQNFIFGAVETTDALRPFAAFGAPIVLEQFERLREHSGAAPSYVFAVADSSGGALLAGVTEEQCRRAYEIIAMADGGAGA